MEATKKTQGKWQIMCLVLLLAGMIFGISRDAAALERIFTENVVLTNWPGAGQYS